METNDTKFPQLFVSEVSIGQSNLLETDCAQKLDSSSQITATGETTKEKDKELELSQRLVQSHLNTPSSSLFISEKNSTNYFNEDITPNKCSTKELQKLSPELEKNSGVRVDSLALNNSHAFIGKKIVNEFATKNIIVVLPEDSDTADATITKHLALSSRVHLFCTLFYKRLIFLLFSILFACSFAYCATHIYLHMRDHSGTNKRKEVVSRNINVVDWDEWGAITKTVNQTCCPLKTVNWVVVHTLYQSEICTNLNECSKLIEGYQHYYDSQFVRHDRGIRENFIIGGDEQIYIGRGWKTVQLINNIKIGILLGNVQNSITNKQIYLAQVLMNVGRRCGKITESFLIRWRCGLCKQYGDVAKILDLAQEGIFRVDSVEEFVEDTDILSRRLCQRGEERDQFCREVSCSRHFSSSCVWCNSSRN